MTTERLCECHGEAMDIRPDGRAECSVKRRARQRAHLLTDKGRARARRFRLRETVRAREARIHRNEKELTYPSTPRSPRPILPGTRSVASSRTA